MVVVVVVVAAAGGKDSSTIEVDMEEKGKTHTTTRQMHSKLETREKREQRTENREKENREKENKEKL